MKKVMNAFIVLLGCLVVAAPVSLAAPAPIFGNIEVTVDNAIITNAVADIGGFTSAGVQTSPTIWQFDTGGARDGETVSVRIVGVSTGGVPVVGVNDAMSVAKAICRDKTNRQRSNGDIFGFDPTECECTGMTPSSGDKLVIRLTGRIGVGGGGDVPN
ncbi:MAG: hypothetical protein JEZ02_12825 [Desulfatibacillum sp.]|nr:hypothetical protein [Desulfatibacillum sp.]